MELPSAAKEKATAVLQTGEEKVQLSNQGHTGSVQIEEKRHRLPKHRTILTWQINLRESETILPEYQRMRQGCRGKWAK